MISKKIEDLLTYAEREGEDLFVSSILNIKKIADGKSKALYTAAYLTKTSSKELKNWTTIKLQSKPMLNSYRPKMIIKRDPSFEDVASTPIGEVVRLKVTGLFEERGVQAVLVSTDFGFQGVIVVYGEESAVDFSSLSVEAIDNGPILEAKVGFWDGRRVKYTLENSVYE